MVHIWELIYSLSRVPPGGWFLIEERGPDLVHGPTDACSAAGPTAIPRRLRAFQKIVKLPALYREQLAICVQPEVGGHQSAARRTLDSGSFTGPLTKVMETQEVLFWRAGAINGDKRDHSIRVIDFVEALFVGIPFQLIV